MLVSRRLCTKYFTFWLPMTTYNVRPFIIVHFKYPSSKYAHQFQWTSAYNYIVGFYHPDLCFSYPRVWYFTVASDLNVHNKGTKHDSFRCADNRSWSIISHDHSNFPLWVIMFIQIRCQLCHRHKPALPKTTNFSTDNKLQLWFIAQVRQ